MISIISFNKTIHQCLDRSRPFRTNGVPYIVNRFNHITVPKSETAMFNNFYYILIISSLEIWRRHCLTFNLINTQYNI